MTSKLLAPNSDLLLGVRPLEAVGQVATKYREAPYSTQDRSHFFKEAPPAALEEALARTYDLVPRDATRNKCIATSNKGLTSSNNVCY